MTYPEETPRGADSLIERLEQVSDAGRRHGDCLEGAALARWQRLDRRIRTLRDKLRVTQSRVTDSLVFEVNHVTREAFELLLDAARARRPPPDSDVDLPS